MKTLDILYQKRVIRQNKEGIKYERIMFEIEREEYETQKNLLTGYKKLLEQANVIDSKLSLVKRLKDISK